MDRPSRRLPLRRRRPRRPRCHPRLAELERRELPSATDLAGLFAHPNAVYTPAQVRHGYGFDQVPALLFNYNSNAGSGQTIAIVDAYEDPNIAADLATFDTQFSLPGKTEAEVASFFTKVDQAGGSQLPAADAGWAGEIALDVEWAHAIAPAARILLVETNSNSIADLLTGVDYAVAAGASVVSLSWGTSEFASEAAYDFHFNRPGVTFLVSSGDNGAPAEWPSASPYVVSVGGTRLFLDSRGNYQTESSWSGSGGGPSRYENRPSFQTSYLNGGGLKTVTGTALNGGKRLTPDVAYDAYPGTGVYVYDSFNGGWFAVGGTSAGAPQWAGLVAIANRNRAAAGLGPLNSRGVLGALYNAATYAANFHDAVGGSNGYLAGTGFDLVTGLGSPRTAAVVAALQAAPGPAAPGTPPPGTGGTKPVAGKFLLQQQAGVVLTLTAA